MDFEKGLDGVARLIQYEARGPLSPPKIRAQAFRNTYCAARLQCLDRGASIARYTVEREMGHSSPEMVTRIYGHLGDIRYRAEHVEYRLERHGSRFNSLGPDDWRRAARNELQNLAGAA